MCLLLNGNNANSITFPTALQHIFNIIKLNMELNGRQGVSHLT